MPISNFIHRSKPHRRAWGVLLLVKFVLFSVTSATPSRYHPIVLPQLDPVNTVDIPARTTGHGLNEKGVVIGEFGFPPRSFLWSSRRGGHLVKALYGSDQAFPLGLSNESVVGSFSSDREAPRPFIAHLGEELMLLPKLVEGPRFAAMATAVSRSGIVVGWCETERPADSATLARHAVIWRNGVITDLGEFGGKESAAVAVTNAGIVAGNFLEAPGSLPRAFRWSQASGLEELPSLQEKSASGAHEINEAGSIVGFAESSATEQGTVRRAVLWSRENRLSILPYVLVSKSESSFAEAFAINNQGQVVGQQRNLGESRMHAVLWEDGQGYALKDLTDDLPAGHHLDRAVAINDRGEILVNGFDQGKTQFIAILLTPISPSSPLL